MKDFSARLLLKFYSQLGKVARPFLPIYLFYRAARGKEDLHRRRERLGKATIARPDGVVVWFHAASVGETAALIGLIEHFLQLHMTVLITTGTTTAAQLIENRFGGRVIHQYAPLDISGAIKRFLDHWQPDCSFVCESEVWPLRIRALYKRKIPQIMINAHLSERSFERWRKSSVLAKYLFAKFDLAITQSNHDTKLYRQLGVRRVATAGNLKADGVLSVDTQTLKRYKEQIKTRPVWAAISTHEGEEQIAGDVHKALKAHIPDLITIIVPRHPERCDEISEMLHQKSLNIVRKSKQDDISDDSDILLGDTIGDMGLYLGLTQIAFIGKSLTSKGGHNPLEPAFSHCALITGPHTENFAEIVEKFVKADAIHIVQDATQLACQVSLYLKQDDIRKQKMDASYKTAKQMSGALHKTINLLQPHIRVLQMQGELAHKRSLKDD